MWNSQGLRELYLSKYLPRHLPSKGPRKICSVYLVNSNPQPILLINPPTGFPPYSLPFILSPITTQSFQEAIMIWLSVISPLKPRVQPRRNAHCTPRPGPGGDDERREAEEQVQFPSG